MTEKINEIIGTQAQDVEMNNQFTQNILHLSALACNAANSNDFDLKKAKKEAQIGLKLLSSKNGLQEMLAAQMLSIHHLQQQAMAFANRAKHIKNIQYFTNAAIKLANCFAQQANILSKLQGRVSQKITVEHVDVHNGGQAIVGNIMEVTHANEVKK